jgi:hypothetical protein
MIGIEFVRLGQHALDETHPFLLMSQQEPGPFFRIGAFDVGVKVS